MSYKTKNFCSPAAIRLSTAILLLASTVNAQDLSSRLSQPAVYQPKATTTLQQLIEVAEHYRIPMGIEWIQETKEESDPLPEPVKRSTVNDLIRIRCATTRWRSSGCENGFSRQTGELSQPANFRV
jgi:hypothetical protein